MKKLLLLLSLAFIINVNAQDDKTVTLVVSGQGKTQDEAKQVALRSAIEQAFGTFISSKTEILNDNLVKDEIISVTNGNIQKYDVLSEVQIPDGGYATTLKAVVSVTKLLSFCESKGVEVEFKGGLFAENIKIQKLNEDAEYKVILNLCKVSKEILAKSLDATIKSADPKRTANESFQIDLNVNCHTNKNYQLFCSMFKKTMKEIALSEEEVNDYRKLNTPTYIIRYISSNNIENIFYLRNGESYRAIKCLMIKSIDNLRNFRIFSEVDTLIADFYIMTNRSFPKCGLYDGSNPTRNIYDFMKSRNELKIFLNDDNYLFFNGTELSKKWNSNWYKWISEKEFDNHKNSGFFIYELFLDIDVNFVQFESLLNLAKITKFNIEPWVNN
jgi:hypothetical protein